MRIAISGGAGYIGCWATKKCLEAGYDVLILEKALFPSGMKYVEGLGAEIAEVDIRDVDLKQYGQVDAVIHLAGLSNDPSAQWNPTANHEMNVVATERLCEQAARADCGLFIFASSASVYGWNTKPKLDENDPISPQSYYSESKALAEEYVRQIGGVVLRQATMMSWSPRHRNDLCVNAMTKSAIETGKIVVNAGGESLRPLVSVSDTAECYVRLLSAPLDAVAGQTLNLNHRRASDAILEGYTIASLGIYIKHLLEANYGVHAEVVGNWDCKEARSYDMTSRKLRALLDWEPSLGVSAAVDSIMAHRHELSDYDQNNIKWMQALEHGQRVTQNTGRVFV